MITRILSGLLLSRRFPCILRGITFILGFWYSFFCLFFESINNLFRPMVAVVILGSVGVHADLAN